MRPKKKPTATYRYDSSLSPSLEWDGQNSAREQGEAAIREILDARSLEQAKAAARKLKALSKPFLTWTGKAERPSFDVPTLPLYVHERLSTREMIETLRTPSKDGSQGLRAYESQVPWVNRLILGDSLVVMNSLLHHASLAGKVQMIYVDPPYGVSFGSNFQPFLRKRDVKHGVDAEMTREPEVVQAYRDTWELGLHSYLTYLRDRLRLARELLSPTGSVFVQISDENVHHVCEVLDEVFGSENFVAIIPFRKKTMPLGTLFAEQMSDFLLWYAKEKLDSIGRPRAKYRKLFRDVAMDPDVNFRYVELPDGTRRELTATERSGAKPLPLGGRLYRLKSLEPSGPMESGKFRPEFEGRTYDCPRNGYAVTPEGMERLIANRRIAPNGNLLNYVLFLADKPCADLTIPWQDTAGADDKQYVVQTNRKVIQRCMLMTTDPGDLVLDPTCGSGTTACVAEQWGRRWIAIDTSRVPLAIARERLLTATFPWYRLQDEALGPAGGFVYERRQNGKGQEIGGIVPHVTLRSITHQEPIVEEVLVDRPETDALITRVTGPFVVEATLPPPLESENVGENRESYGPFVERMVEVLRMSPHVHLQGGQRVTFENVRLPARTMTLSAEAQLNGQEKPVALVFGPENGVVSEKLVHEALKEARQKSYSHLFVIGFGIQPQARDLVERARCVAEIGATYVQATPDLMMGDLLKSMRSSQIFSVCGLPDIRLAQLEERKYQVELLGLDVFDPIDGRVESLRGADVPAWFLDTDYDARCFRVRQAFFPRTSAWKPLRAALKSTDDDGVWDLLAGTKSAAFEPGEHQRIAVKVIDARGNELLVSKRLSEAQE